MPAHKTIAQPTQRLPEPTPAAPRPRAAVDAARTAPRPQPADALSATLARALLQRTPAAQVDIDRAAAALDALGHTPVMKKAAYTKWLKEKTGTGHTKQTNSMRYSVGDEDFAAVIVAIGVLKLAAAATRRLDETERKLQQFLLDSQQAPPGGVWVNRVGVIGYLDADQLPHQPKGGTAIGTRTASKDKGSRFGSHATAAWHQTHTLVTMTDWAAGLGLADGDVQLTGQAEARDDNIYYEGQALRSRGQTYVFFHCYPSKDFVNT
jgi:hypothetical protein